MTFVKTQIYPARNISTLLFEIIFSIHCPQIFEMNQELHDACCQRIVESFTHLFGFANHATESFEHFLHNLLPEIIQEPFPLNIHSESHQILHRIFLDHISFKRPTVQVENTGFLRDLNTTESVLRKQSYFFEIFLNLSQKSYRASGTSKKYVLYDHRSYRNLLFAKIPCLVKSSACHHSQQLDSLSDDGLFIINGYEKVIISQEKLRTNYPYIFSFKGKYSHRLECRSSHKKFRSTSTLKMYITAEKNASVPQIDVHIPFLTRSLPLIVVFRLLGVDTVPDMLALILLDTSSETLRYKVASLLNHDTSETAHLSYENLLEWVGTKATKEKLQKKRIATVRNIVQSELLPHVANDVSTPETTRAAKAFFLGYSIRKFLSVYIGESPCDDIDDFQNKRICTVGMILTLFIRQLLRSNIKSINREIFKNMKDNQIVNLSDIINHRQITSHLRYACGTGNFGAQKTSSNQSGVCQVLNDTNITARLASGKHSNTPLNRDGKLAQPRQLHKSHLGLYCAFETPEGKSVGLLHQLGLLTRIRTGTTSHLIIQILKESLGVIPLQKGLTLVLVNGVVAGCTANPLEFVSTYKAYRRDHSVPIESSITYSNEISILTDAEDCFRPLFSCENLYKIYELVRIYGPYLHLLWHQLLLEGCIEYINKAEEQELFIAENIRQLTNGKKYTHLELDQSLTLFGLSAGIIPFAHHNQSPRNIYQCVYHREPVLLADNSWKRICDLNFDDLIVTFDPRTGELSTTSITWSTTMVTEKKLIHIATASGHEIIVTEDHLMFTANGWKEAKDVDCPICIYDFESRCLVFDTIQFRSPAHDVENVISDLTTSSSTHCFIAGRNGGFGVHNSSMGKQALSVQPLTFSSHLPTKAHVLNEGQKPLVSTFISQLIGYDDEPAGANCYCAITHARGFNQEVILSSLQTLFIFFAFRTLLFSTRLRLNGAYFNPRHIDLSVTVRSVMEQMKNALGHMIQKDSRTEDLATQTNWTQRVALFHQVRKFKKKICFTIRRSRHRNRQNEMEVTFLMYQKIASWNES
jgi:DNA-directed RNA polymerase beta subunit